MAEEEQIEDNSIEEEKVENEPEIEASSAEEEEESAPIEYTKTVSYTHLTLPTNREV